MDYEENSFSQVWNDEQLQHANIPSTYARIIGHELGLNLRDLPKLIQFTSLDTQQFIQEDTFFSTQQFIQIFHNSLKLSKIPEFGLRLGKRLTPTTHGAMGFLVNSSPNLCVALKAVQNFLPTRISFAHLDLHYTPNTVICTLNFSVHLSPDIFRLISESCMVIFYECAEFIIGRRITEGHIYFAHQEPEYGNEYDRYFMSKFSFSHQKLQVELPLELCDIPNVSANQETFLLARSQCETMLHQLKPTKRSYNYLIKKMMLSSQLNHANEEAIASALFMSKRTLARHLNKEGTSFREIRDHILSQQASEYLLKTNLSVETIASLLHYHDSANFRRAFKRWFNTTPQSYRHFHQN